LRKGDFELTDRVSSFGLEDQGIETGAELHWNLMAAPLVEHAVRRSEGLLAKDGPLVVKTGKHTGRSAKDKFTVTDELTRDVIWWNDGNKPMDPAAFDRLHQDFLAALGEKDELFVQDLYGGSQPEHRVRVRVINELAWHSLFSRTLLVRPEASELAGFVPEFTIIDLPSFRANPDRHGSRSETVVAVNFTKKLILIGGTAYAGEMKKSVFGLLNFILPPIAKLTPEQAMYHFLSGYTAKVAGTEIGVTEPQATFSTCFGAPFMPRHPSVYGNLLKKRIAEGQVDCWLVNTGWTGGKYGVGKRMPIKATRALLNAALDGTLKNARFRKDSNFGFQVPLELPGCTELLDPRSTWSDPAEYDAMAAKLVDLFVENFAQFADQVDEGVRQAAPKRAQQQAQQTQTQPTAA
jgi:ATP-dependent phosphoenolpyruvate carboxykinase